MVKKARLKTMKTLSTKCHWEVMKGKLADSEKYCSKQGDLKIIGKWVTAVPGIMDLSAFGEQICKVGYKLLCFWGL